MKLVSIPANPVPEGVTVGTVKTSDGVVLRFARFDPPAGRKGTLGARGSESLRILEHGRRRLS